MTRDREESVRMLISRFGDPLQQKLKRWAAWAEIYNEIVDKPVGRQNKRRLREAEEMLCRYENDILPYTRPRFQAIAQTTTDLKAVVIRAPEKVDGSAEWLARFAPHRDAMVNEGPPASPAARLVQTAYNAASKAGYDVGAAEILKDATKAAEQDPAAEFTDSWNERMLKGYDN
jgi:hypothetical protein